jgi:hypothetical protein
MHSPRLGLLRDAARGLAQQMVWWGYDVRHPDGNLLVVHGMSRNPSPGLAGTSCYRCGWENGWIELHGAVASWTAADATCGVIYARDRGRLELWTGDEPPVPGREFGSHGTAEERWQAALPMIRWIGDYEARVRSRTGTAWRDGCWRAIRRLPKGKPWLPPAAALDWWRQASSTRAPLRAERVPVRP